MTKRSRRTHVATLKAKVALAVLKGDKTLAELAQRDGLHPRQITDGKQPLREHAVDVFGGARVITSMGEPAVDLNAARQDRQTGAGA